MWMLHLQSSFGGRFGLILLQPAGDKNLDHVAETQTRIRFESGLFVACVIQSDLHPGLARGCLFCRVHECEDFLLARILLRRDEVHSVVSNLSNSAEYFSGVMGLAIRTLNESAELLILHCQSPVSQCQSVSAVVRRACVESTNQQVIMEPAQVKVQGFDENTWRIYFQPLDSFSLTFSGQV